MTLNAGFSYVKEDPVSTEDRDLVAEFLKHNQVTKLQPAALDGNEMAKHNRERLTKLRKEFRDKQKEAREKK